MAVGVRIGIWDVQSTIERIRTNIWRDLLGSAFISATGRLSAGL